MLRRVNKTMYKFPELKFTPVYGIDILKGENKFWDFYNANEAVWMYDMIMEDDTRLVAAGLCYELTFEDGSQSWHFDHYINGKFPDWYLRFNQIYPDAKLKNNSQMFRLFKENEEPIGNFFRWYAWQYLPKVKHKRIIYTDEFPIRRKKAVEYTLYGKRVKYKKYIPKNINI